MYFYFRNFSRSTGQLRGALTKCEAESLHQSGGFYVVSMEQKVCNDLRFLAINTESSFISLNTVGPFNRLRSSWNYGRNDEKKTLTFAQGFLYEYGVQEDSWTTKVMLTMNALGAMIVETRTLNPVCVKSMEFTPEQKPKQIEFPSFGQYQRLFEHTDEVILNVLEKCQKRIEQYKPGFKQNDTSQP